MAARIRADALLALKPAAAKTFVSMTTPSIQTLSIASWRRSRVKSSLNRSRFISAPNLHGDVLEQARTPGHEPRPGSGLHQRARRATHKKRYGVTLLPRPSTAILPSKRPPNLYWPGAVVITGATAAPALSQRPRSPRRP